MVVFFLCYARGMKHLLKFQDYFLLVACLLLLPLLPNVLVDPLQVINPHRVMLIIILLQTLVLAGRWLSHVLGTRLGLPVAGLVGGFASSSATVAALGHQARELGSVHRAAVAGAVLSTLATFIQLAILLRVISADLLGALVPSLVMGGVCAMVYGGYHAVRAFRSPAVPLPELRPSTGFKAAVVLAGLLVLVGMGVALLRRYLGEEGVMVGAALAGLLDAHAIAATLGNMVDDGDLLASQAVIPVLIGFSSNTLVRIVICFSLGSPRFAREVGMGLILGLAGAWAGYFI